MAFNVIKRFNLSNWLFPRTHLQSAQGRIWINLSLLSLSINYRTYYRNKNGQLPSWEQCRRRTSSLPRWWRGPWASPGTAWWASPPSWAGWPAYAPPPSQHNTHIQYPRGQPGPCTQWQSGASFLSWHKIV